MARIPLDQVSFRKELYPRIKQDPALAQRYAEDLPLLPAIEVNQNGDLIDGWHRWTAHKIAEAETIEVTVTQTASDLHLLALAAKRNASFGWQMDGASKKHTAVMLYQRGEGYLPEHAPLEKESVLARAARIKADIGADLSLQPSTVAKYLSDVEKSLRDERREMIFSLWLACWTQEQIAEVVGVEQKTVSTELGELYDLESMPKSIKLLALHEEEGWTPPLYDLWNAPKNANEVKHFGNTPVEFVDYLLYLYTQPFEIVVDPCAGGGSTIDICKQRLRRYWASDRKPIIEREDIRQHDLLTDGISGPSRWGDVALVYLDPPYWKQAEGQYSDDPSDLANMTLDEFTQTLVGIVHGYAVKLRAGAHVACIISPTQWPNEDKSTVYHDLDLVRLVGKKARLVQRVLCPYSTQQYNGTQVDIAKERRLLMALTRTLLVWEIQA